MYVTSEATVDRVGNFIFVDTLTDSEMYFFVDTTLCDQKFIELVWLYMD